MDRKVLMLAVILFALAVRFQNFGEIFDSGIYYTGYDSYYHMRLVEVMVKESFRPDYDYYINYPFGLKITWPPLFDYILAFPGMLFGFHSSEIFAVFLPVILGVLSVVLICLTALQIVNNQTFALISAFIYAAAPVAVWKTVLGQADHHALVIFLFLLSAYLLLKDGVWKILAGLPMLFMALAWLGSPIYGALLAFSALVHFDRKALRLVAASYLIPAISFVLYPPVGISFFGLAAFLFVGSVVKGYEDRFRNATIYYIALSLATVLIIYFIPLPHFEFVKGGINYIFGANIYLPTISEARSLQIFEIISASGYIYFIFALISVLFFRNRFVLSMFFLSFILALMQLRFTEVLVVPSALLSAYLVSLVLERLEYPVFEKADEEEKSRRRKRKDRKVKQKNAEVDWKDHVVVAAFLVILAVPCLVVAVAPFDLTEDWKEALEWMRTSLEEQNYLNPYEKPEYSVMSWWDYGNWILYVSKKAVVCNNFQAGAVDAAKFFTAKSEDEAIKIAKKRGVRYVVTADEITMKDANNTKFPAIMRIAGYNVDLMTEGEILNFFNHTVLYRLHMENAENLTHFRLVKEFGDVKIFEVVGS
ncbi:MAG: Transmembrane oligosaccharyl transferase, putative [Archaeoglobus fulgidus]|uniref:dolichyl-phosphooligosaccharide-protein glycotransferase n=1 Tax=Archaeoglobus fulgidus TaxID=2234 RepID=A0A117KLI4_ARCFL|nr:dolichyl-phosphooligosaccharide-protein glycotransferase AglB1 [Archaeoglobus fulgidus]KUJ92711.1 MAG: Transmembrane oligosaccharyl transferase, putative [Archaeoglobus fulgidus]KUK05895.1 MAG: Transmembrane oligosaccharyl transferase, putative [Archaeoglobus fulgidus]